MKKQWTVGQKIALGLGGLALITVFISALAIFALSEVSAAKDRVIDIDARALIASAEVGAAFDAKVASGRGYLISLNQDHLDSMHRKRAEFSSALERLQRVVSSADDKQSVADIGRLEQQHQAALEAAFELRRGQTPVEEVAATFEKNVAPLRQEVQRLQDAFQARTEQSMENAKMAAAAFTDRMEILMGAIAAAGVVVAFVLTMVLSRGIARQIGTAIQHIQTSSAQLQSATAEQVAGTKEQTSAVAEVSATLKELVSTARQMMENAQRVTRVAEEATSSARNGTTTVQRTQEAVSAIKKQVDLIVGHMLDLGKKSQQIGSILEIINELAEQTNILSINATIESAGAGENGRRFAVVADEIRKLADRVGGSSKEIRVLIDEIRSAANTTVMATEDGSKAVETGIRQFEEVTRVFQQIAEMVETTTDASREIELGTRQQVSAVEQVNAALSGVGQAAKDAEATTRQTQDTATQLSQLSRNLTALVRAHGSSVSVSD